ncbi:MAG: 4a-hydroxytetrahydrobiopterin dehydratase [Planctomycetota bacterium]
MEILTAEQLAEMTCAPGESGVARYPDDKVAEQLGHLDGWQVTEDGKRIRKEWTVANFLAGLEFFSQVGEIAEEICHHPDLHLVGYKNLAIEIWTHTLDGLSENDFILAAKINRIPAR